MPPIFPVVRDRFVRVGAAAGHMKPDFSTLVSFAKITRDTAFIKLTLRGRDLCSFETRMDMEEALGRGGININDLSSNLKLLIPALDGYHDMYSRVFRRTSVAFLGEPEIEVPSVKLKVGEKGDETVISAWINEFLLSNISNAASVLAEEGSPTVNFRGIPLTQHFLNRKSGVLIDWDRNTVNRLFLFMFYLENALKYEAVEKAAVIDFERTEAQVLDLACRLNPEVEDFLAF